VSQDVDVATCISEVESGIELELIRCNDEVGDQRDFERTPTGERPTRGAIRLDSIDAHLAARTLEEDVRVSRPLTVIRVLRVSELDNTVAGNRVDQLLRDLHTPAFEYREKSIPTAADGERRFFRCASAADLGVLLGVLVGSRRPRARRARIGLPHGSAGVPAPGGRQRRWNRCHV
jgi:hypothetical protein